MQNQSGQFIVLEGLEGAGKTTAINTVSNTLKQHGIIDIIYTREPGGTPIAEALRAIIKSASKEDPITNEAELLMFYAARIQLIENVIKPALSQGKWVIGDRHDLSTQAYQGGGRLLDKTLIKTLKKAILKDFEPNLTLYLDIVPEVGLQRARNRGELDRIEQESLPFFERVRTEFLSLSTQYPKTIRIIDANQSLEQVQQSIASTIEQWLIDE